MDFPYVKILKQAYGIVRDHKFLWIHGLFLFWGRAAIIISVKALLDKQEAGLVKGFVLARRFNKRAISVSIIINTALMVIAAGLAAPILYLYAENLLDRAVILGTLGLCIFIPFAAVLTMLNIMSAHFICLYDRRISESFLAGWDLIVRKWLTLLFFSVLLWLAISIAFAALIFVVFLIVLVFSAIPAWIFGALILAPSLAIIFAFHQSAWTLAFMELVKPVKFEEAAQAAPVAETVA